MSLSLALTGFVNFITFLASLPLIGVGIWLATKLGTECVKFLEWPVIVIGVAILLITLAGCIGSCYRIPWLLWFYLVVMFLLILLLIAFIIFAYVVTKDGPSASNGRRDYKLNEYSPWLRHELNSGNWRKIRSCVISSNLCSDLNDKYTTYASFQEADLSPVEAGCCTPPSICGFQYQFPTVWSSNPTSSNADQDCGRWDNSQSIKCYNCDTCKAGVAAQVKQGWRKAAVLCLVVLIVLIVVELIGCCAFRNAQIHDLFKHYETGVYWRRHWFNRWLRSW